MNLSQKLKYARRRQRLTQKQVAQIACVSRKTLSGWENARSVPDIDSLVKLSHIYKLSLDSLLNDEAAMNDRFSQRVHLVYTKKVSMIFYDINLLLCAIIFALLLIHQSAHLSLVPLFLVINLAAFFYHFVSWHRFKNIKYTCAFLLTFIAILAAFVITNRQLFDPRTDLISANATALRGFLFGRYLFALVFSLGLTVIFFFNPKKLFLKKVQLVA